MRKNKRTASPDLLQACQRLAETAEAFVNRAPRQKRLEAERSALFDALSHAQLVLSVTRLPQETGGGPSKKENLQRDTRGLEDQLKQSRADLAKSQQALEQLDWLIEPMVTTLDELQDKTKRAHTIVKTALKAPGRVLPFQKSK
jgi:hypothetical protein